MIDQTSLPKERRRDLRWGSHVPVCAAAIDAFPISGVLELGAGYNSTPMFFDRLEHAVSIEADDEWIARLRETIVEDDTHRLVHHPLPGYRRGTLHGRVHESALRAATEFYCKHRTSAHNMLFVDCYAGFRLRAIEDMYQFTDVCLYHDAEPEHDYQYGYSTLVVHPEFTHFIDRTFLAHTGIIVAPRMRSYLPKFIECLRKRAGEYAMRFAVSHRMTIEYRA